MKRFDAFVDWLVGKFGVNIAAGILATLICAILMFPVTAVTGDWFFFGLVQPLCTGFGTFLGNFISRKFFN